MEACSKHGTTTGSQTYVINEQGRLSRFLNVMCVSVEITFENLKKLSFVVIEKCDEFMYCINSDDYSVVHWSPYDTVGVVDVADDFCQFLYETITDAIDNY